MFAFPSGAEIGPDERIVVALDAVGFFTLYGFTPDYEISGSDPSVPDLVPYELWGSGTVVLSNTGDEILLVDPLDQPVDIVVYENGTYSGVTAHPGVPTGSSIARSPAGQDTDDCSVDFIELEVPTPGG